MRSSRHNLSLKILIFVLVFLSTVYISLISSEQWGSATSQEEERMVGTREATTLRQRSDNGATTSPNWVEINAIKIPKSAEHIADESRKKKKLFVIIVAGFRTGSTLLGEFFNRNDEIFYIFEPLHQVRTLRYFSSYVLNSCLFQIDTFRMHQNTLVT